MLSDQITDFVLDGAPMWAVRPSDQSATVTPSQRVLPERTPLRASRTGVSDLEVNSHR
jgi:hypothetical protein